MKNRVVVLVLPLGFCDAENCLMSPTTMHTENGAAGCSLEVAVINHHHF